jgi:hypothetical protein
VVPWVPNLITQAGDFQARTQPHRGESTGGGGDGEVRSQRFFRGGGIRKPRVMVFFGAMIQWPHLGFTLFKEAGWGSAGESLMEITWDKID